MKGKIMSNKGLAETSTGTISAPTMYEEIEVIEDVARGHVKVVELIAYDFDKMEDVIDELTNQPTGAKRKLEKSRGPFFCQTKEQELAFKNNNPGARIETFNVQLLKSTAIEKLDDPKNMKAFEEAK